MPREGEKDEQKGLYNACTNTYEVHDYEFCNPQIIELH
jgi:hypothetical protein